MLKVARRFARDRTVEGTIRGLMSTGRDNDKETRATCACRDNGGPVEISKQTIGGNR
jgi:hypothetical protein